MDVLVGPSLCKWEPAAKTYRSGGVVLLDIRKSHQIMLNLYDILILLSHDIPQLYPLNHPNLRPSPPTGGRPTPE